jgi:hypothetical protein
MLSLSNAMNINPPLPRYFSGGQNALVPEYSAFANQWLGDETDAPTDLATATRAGRVADIIALLIDSSGMRQVYFIEFKRNVNEESIKLLQSWIGQYGSDRDPDLEQQMRELNANRVVFRR